MCKFFPTAKQVEFADEIAITLNIDFPNSFKDYNSYRYSKFIAEHINEYNEVMNATYCDEEYLSWIDSYYNDVWCEHY